MNWMINLIAKWSGLSWIWAKTDGIKGYITSAITILTGVIGLLNEFLTATGDHNFATLWAFLQNIIAHHDANWGFILLGCAGIAAFHKAAKNAAAVVAALTVATTDVVSAPDTPENKPQ